MDDTADRHRPGWPLWAGVVALLTGLLAASGIEAALHFSGIPVDGPFQLFNALRRMAAGQRLGVAFQFFHGAGIPLLHYLPFRVLGGDLAASELSRQLISIVAGPITLLFLFRVFTQSWTRAWALTALGTAALITLRISALLEPGFSLVAVRSSVPLLLPIVLAVVRSRGLRAMAAGVTIGASTLVSTEQGIALAAAYLVTLAVIATRSRSLGAMSEMAVGIATALVTVAGVLVLTSGGDGMRSALEYNFRLVPLDQYWFFGAPPSHIAASWRGLAARLGEYPAIALVVPAGIAIAAVQLRRTRGASDAALTVLVLHGVIACASLLGYFDPVYVAPCIRMLVVVGALELDRRVSGDGFMLGLPRRLTIVVGVALLAASVTSSRLWRGARDASHLVADHLVRGHGMAWSDDWLKTQSVARQAIDREAQRLGHTPTVWSTYSGWLEAELDAFNPASDYMIHAIGPERRAQYLEVFRARRPDVVQTVAPYYTDHELFLEQTWWDVYAELLRNYQVVAETHWSLLWSRAREPRSWPAPYWSTTTTAERDSITFPVPAGSDTALYRSLTLLEIELDYRAENRARWVPVIGHMPRYFATVTGAFNPYPATLDPYRTTVRFPVVVPRNASPALLFASHSLLGGSRLILTAVRIREVPVTRENGRWLMRVVGAQSRFGLGVRDIIY